MNEISQAYGGKRIVFYIDDLDRLQPLRAVELLEVLKIFLDCEKCVYNGSVVKTKKISFYNELTCMFRGRKNPPSGYLSYAAYGRSIAG